VIVVTGAARGIGRAAAEGFRAEGARVVGVDRSWSGELELGDRAFAATVDIAEPVQVASCVSETLSRFGRVDALINNAARRQRDLYPPEGIVSVLDTTEEDWRSMFEVNVMGALNMTRAFVPALVEAGGGSVVTIGTRGSVLRPAGPGTWEHTHPAFRNQPYDATKAALCSLSLYLAEELREAGIAVNVVFPGPTFTTGSDAIVASRLAAGVDARPFLRPDHLVPVLLHLARQRPTGGETGLAIDSLEWNRTHGYGDTHAWEHA
jgi:NAD(P)-dependent dehydrogenase (short-subunit alcohol dehydrogenase family)